MTGPKTLLRGGSATTWFAAVVTALSVAFVGWFAYQQGQLSAGRARAC